MFSLESVSTFGETLQSIERLIKSQIEQNQLINDLGGFEIGVDRKPRKFPYLIVYPIYEEVVRVYTSNGFADVNRAIQFEVKSFKTTQESSFGQVNGLLNNIKILFTQRRNKKLWRLKNILGNIIVFGTRVSEIAFDDPDSSGDGLHMSARITIIFKSQIKINEYAILNEVKNLYDTSNLKELVKIVDNILSGYKGSILNEVKTFKFGAVKDLKKLPGVITTANDAIISPAYAGVDSYRTDIFISAYSQLFGGIKPLYENLDIIDKIRKIIFANKYFYHRALNYNIDRIEYGIVEKGTSLLFSSQLTFSIWTYDKY